MSAEWFWNSDLIRLGAKSEWTGRKMMCNHMKKNEGGQTWKDGR